METGYEEVSLPDPRYENFKNEFRKLTGINLHAYKEKQMKRRINTLIERKGVDGYESFMGLLRSKPDELAFFTDYITINVTEFFRTPEHWASFEETVLRDLALRQQGPLKLWSTACSTGEEPYSVVMSLAKYLPLDEIHVLATDIDRKALAQAEAGIFCGKSMEAVPDELKRKYFTCADGSWRICETVKRCVEFRQLDLLTAEYPASQDLIICRNVLIYFTEGAKNEIYNKFHSALSYGGYLFTGNTEQIIQYKNFGYTKYSNFIYQKPVGSVN